MISSKELRIGNTVSEINIGEINVSLIDIEAIQRGDTNYKPIPLTEELFLRLGYKILVGHSNHYFLSGHVIFICDDLIICDKTRIILKSLHQLQNLYFALKNKELKR